MKLPTINLTKEGTHNYTILSCGLVVNEHYADGKYVFDGIGDLKKPCRIWYLASCDDGFDTEDGHIDFWNGVIKASPSLYASIEGVPKSQGIRQERIDDYTIIGCSYTTEVRKDGQFTKYKTVFKEKDRTKPYPCFHLTQKVYENIRPITGEDNTTYCEDVMKMLIETVEETYNVRYNAGEFFTNEELGLVP